MSIRPKFSLLFSLFLTAGIIIAQQAAPSPPPAPPDAPLPPGELAFPDDLFGNAFSLFVGGGSFLGVYAEDIDKEKTSRYGLSAPRGVGITRIVESSPAEKAGLKKGDVILRFDNENVTSVRKLNRLVGEVAPDQTVRLGISRGGSEQETSVTIGNRKEYSNAKGVMRLPRAEVWSSDKSDGDHDAFVLVFGKDRRIGITTTQLTKQLADYFGVADGRGVLVTSVADESPAAKAGIKAGDVITAADGEKIERAGDLSRAINKKKDGDVTLTVIRNKSQRSITVTPKEGGEPGLLGAPGKTGRRVVVPRIDLGEIPEINIRMPRIELPVIPEINVELPGKIRRARVETVNRPI